MIDDSDWGKNNIYLRGGRELFKEVIILGFFFRERNLLIEELREYNVCC